MSRFARMIAAWLAAAWAWACGVHSPARQRVLVDDPAPAGKWWRRLPTETGRRIPRVALLMAGAAGIALLSVAPATVITGSAPANAEIFNTCMIMPNTVGQGPATAFDGTASMVPRMNMGYGVLSASDTTNDTTLFSTHQTAKEVAATATDQPQTAASARTAWEVFGAGMNWTAVGFDGAGNAQCSIVDSMITFAANGVFWLPRIVTDFTIKLKDFATGPSPLAAVYESDTIGADDTSGSTGVIANLRDSFMIAALSASIAICGFWVLSKARGSSDGGSNKRTITAGLTWSFMCALIAVSFLVGNNWWKVIQATDTGVAQANSVIADAMTKAATQPANNGKPAPVQNPCLLPKEAPNAGLRESSCSIYNTILFQPWALGEFGSDANNGSAMMMRVGQDPPPGNANAYPIWKSAKLKDGATASFWQWAGCGSLDKNGEYKLITDKSSWPWTSDDTKRVIDAFTCIPKGGLDKGTLTGCTIQSTMGDDACRDIRLVTLSIIGSNPYDYTRLGDTADLRKQLQEQSQSNPAFGLLQDYFAAIIRSIPTPDDPKTLPGDTSLPELRTSDVAQRQLLAFTNYVGQGTTVNSTMRGQNGINRIGLAIMSLIVGLIMAILIGYLAMLVLLWHVVTLMMVIILPVVAIFALPPPGMKIGIWWLREFVSSFILRFMYGIAISLVIVLLQAVTTANMPLGIKLLTLVLVIAALWTLIKEIRSGALTPTFGGEKASMGNTMARTAAVGGAVVAYAGWKARRPAARALRGGGRYAGGVARNAGRKAKGYKDYLRNGPSPTGGATRGGGRRTSNRSRSVTPGSAPTTGPTTGPPPGPTGGPTPRPGGGGTPAASAGGAGSAQVTPGSAGSGRRQVLPNDPGRPDEPSPDEPDQPTRSGHVTPQSGTRSRPADPDNSGPASPRVAPGDAPSTGARPRPATGGTRPKPNSGTRGAGKTGKTGSGGQQQVTPQRQTQQRLCMRCKGTGHVKNDSDGGSDTVTCPVCNGRGRVFRR